MLNTKDIKTGGGSLPKTLAPGNHKVTIFKVNLEDFTFKPGAKIISIHVEGEPIEGFEGWPINRDKPELGNHKGQIARVRATEYAFSDGATKSGIPVSRDQEMLKFLKSLCIELNCVTWLEDQDGKHATIESLFEAFDNDKPYKDKPLNVCLAGKEYLNKEGYTAYDLFFPKFSRTGVPFEGVGKAKNKVVVFDPEVHIKKRPVENVQSFGEEGPTNPGGNEFQL